MFNRYVNKLLKVWMC